MIRTLFAPGMRRMGFVGSGQAYRLEVDEYWAQAGIQRSTGSPAQAVLFTINFSVVSTRDWERYRQLFPGVGVRPSPNVAWGSGPWGRCWWKRIGELMIVGGHRYPFGNPWFPAGEPWLSFRADQPFDLVADEALEAVREFGLPALLAQVAAR
jgi:hypothetical protein